jgi:hypothetical protein
VTDLADISIPQWGNGPLTLYHGTDERSIESIRRTGIDLSFGRELLDFGPGFYVTTSEAQSRVWAEQKVDFARSAHGDPRVLRFLVPRDHLAELECLWFVRGSADALDFWSFVTYCRNGGLTHARTTWYDIVIGPVARNFRKRTILNPDSDQISFHTDRAVKLLDPSTAEVISW